MRDGEKGVSNFKRLNRVRLMTPLKFVIGKCYGREEGRSLGCVFRLLSTTHLMGCCSKET